MIDVLNDQFFFKMPFLISAFVHNHFFFLICLCRFEFISFLKLILAFEFFRIGLCRRNSIKNKFANEILDQTIANEEDEMHIFLICSHFLAPLNFQNSTSKEKQTLN